MIFALTGFPHVGKDTLAKFLIAQYGFQRYYFAKGIYREVSQAFGVTEEELGSQEWKQVPQKRLSLAHCTDVDYINVIKKFETAQDYSISTPRTSRQHLQWWGTEYRRAQDIGYWTKQCIAEMEKDGAPNIVITDLRELHEHDAIVAYAKRHNQKLQVIEIMRAGCHGSKHSSDSGIPHHLLDRSIRNFDNDPEHMCNLIAESPELNRIELNRTELHQSKENV